MQWLNQRVERAAVNAKTFEKNHYTDEPVLVGIKEQVFFHRETVWCKRLEGGIEEQSGERKGEMESGEWNMA